MEPYSEQVWTIFDVDETAGILKCKKCSYIANMDKKQKYDKRKNKKSNGSKDTILTPSLQEYRAKYGPPVSSIVGYDPESCKWRMAYHVKYHEEKTTEDYETWLGKQPKFKYTCRLDNCNYTYLRDLTTERTHRKSNYGNRYQS